MLILLGVLFLTAGITHHTLITPAHVYIISVRLHVCAMLNQTSTCFEACMSCIEALCLLSCCHQPNAACRLQVFRV